MTISGTPSRAISDGVGVAKLVRREASAYAGRGRGASELCASGRGCPRSAARRSVDDAEQRPDGKLDADFEPGLEFLPAPVVHADFASASALAASDQQRAASLIEIGLGEVECFLDAQPGSPKDDDQAADTLLDAIGRSDGTRGSVLEQLRRTREPRGLVGEVGFDERGDIREGAERSCASSAASAGRESRVSQAPRSRT